MRNPVDLRVSSMDLRATSMMKSHRDPPISHGVARKIVLSCFLLCLFLQSPAQEQFRSVHFEQNEFYGQFGAKPASFYDSLDGFAGKLKYSDDNGCEPRRIVFGYHPYWAGSDYLNYQWNLLTDLCYFSYEVDPSTGEPLTIHDWLTEPAVDSAISNGVRVHLCVTLFSGHATFFSNPVSRQTLIDNLVSLVIQRGARGINLDFEAVPSSQGNNMTSFVADLRTQLNAQFPDAILSMAIPAVNWNGTFDIPALKDHLDFFMVMGYDYYWNGSAEAGPVAPLFSLTLSNDYSLSMTISEYLAAGMPGDKFILGVPYYGRQWKTKTNMIPSQILAFGTVLTYANIRNNSGTIYTLQHYRWEPVSFSSAFVFFQNSNWYQCFIGLDRDVRKWYDRVNYFGLAGIGIWALGYDDGYPELWQAISDKFTDCYIPLVFDSIFDAGGPAWNYYRGEDHVMTIDHGWNNPRHLTFTQLNLEEGFDSLVIFAGSDTLSPKLAALTGEMIPGNFTSPNGAFTLKFHSDPVNTRQGWTAVYHDGTLGTGDRIAREDESFILCPNPAGSSTTITLTDPAMVSALVICDAKGCIVLRKEIEMINRSSLDYYIDLDPFPVGSYTITLVEKTGRSRTCLLLIY